LDGKTSEQKKDDQPILPQGAEPVGQGMWPLVSQSKMRPILDELNANLTDYKLDTNLRKAHFFAQVMQEVGPHFKL